MARLADLLTKASEGRLVFNRFDDHLIIADAINAQLEAQHDPDEAALYIDDEIVVDGNNLDVARYRDILPPFDRFWIEAKSVRYPGNWTGIMCRAYTQAQAREKSTTRREVERMLKGTGIEIGDAIEYGWLLNMYPIIAKERGGGRLEVVCPHSMQQIFLDKDGNLMTPRAMSRPAQDLYRQFKEMLRLPDLAIDVSVAAAPLVLETLALMGCVNVKQERIDPNPAQSKAHQRKHGAPLSSYTILTFKGRNISALPPTHEGGTHASPREHWVRRHYKWRNGKRYLWNHFMRGNPDRGRVAKTYEADPPPDETD